jgi:hypothetical protein
MKNRGLFTSKCGCGCGQEVFVYAKDKLGTLPVTYVDKIHEGNAKYKKRFDKRFT